MAYFYFLFTCFSFFCPQNCAHKIRFITVKVKCYTNSDKIFGFNLKYEHKPNANLRWRSFTFLSLLFVALLCVKLVCAFLLTPLQYVYSRCGVRGKTFFLQTGLYFRALTLSLREPVLIISEISRCIDYQLSDRIHLYHR